MCRKNVQFQKVESSLNLASKVLLNPTKSTMLVPLSLCGLTMLALSVLTDSALFALFWCVPHLQSVTLPHSEVLLRGLSYYFLFFPLSCVQTLHGDFVFVLFKDV